VLEELLPPALDHVVDAARDDPEAHGSDEERAAGLLHERRGEARLLAGTSRGPGDDLDGKDAEREVEHGLARRLEPVRGLGAAAERDGELPEAERGERDDREPEERGAARGDRKSTRLNSSHVK